MLGTLVIANQAEPDKSSKTDSKTKKDKEQCIRRLSVLEEYVAEKHRKSLGPRLHIQV